MISKKVEEERVIYHQTLCMDWRITGISYWRHAFERSKKDH